MAPAHHAAAAIDPDGLVLRIDLRDYQWDAILWNRLLAEYPYGVLPDTAAARAVLVATATRVPCVRADWFLANASRAPLYYDLLQIPSNLSELERQLRVDVAAGHPAGARGAGRLPRLRHLANNRLLERHDAMNGAYWRTYDFEAIPQNLVDRDLLLPDRRNLFAYPLGPGFADGHRFQHAAGEAIFNLPNGLQGYLLVNANDVRQNKGNTAIVSDPKRPDRRRRGRRLVHVVSLLAASTPRTTRSATTSKRIAKSFSRSDAEVIRALYVPKEKMRALMDEDAERFRKALEKTGNKVSASEPVMTRRCATRPTWTCRRWRPRSGLKPDDLLRAPRRHRRSWRELRPAEGAGRHGAAAGRGAGVRRRWCATCGWARRSSRAGRARRCRTTPARSIRWRRSRSPANAVAFSPDGRLRRLRQRRQDGADLGRGGAAASCAAASATRRRSGASPSRPTARALSGGDDATVRLWDVETGREIAAERSRGTGDEGGLLAGRPQGAVRRLRSRRHPLGPGERPQSAS